MTLPSDRARQRLHDRTLRELIIASLEDDLVLTIAALRSGILACAAASARTGRYGDIAVATVKAFRGRNYARAASALVAGRLQAVGLVPVWSTGESSWASQRIAVRVGFTPVRHRCSVVLTHESRVEA